MHSLHIAMLAAVGIAAYTDSKTGLIPNWLTLPLIALGPIYWLVTESSEAGLRSLLAVLVVGLVPYLMYRMDSLGGGDVKLFAGLGGLGGITLGLEVLMYSLIAAMFVAVLLMAARGQLTVIAINVGRIIANPFLPKNRRKPPERNEMHQFRLGLSILAGTAFTLGYNYGLV